MVGCATRGDRPGELALSVNPIGRSLRDREHTRYHEVARDDLGVETVRHTL